MLSFLLGHCNIVPPPGEQFGVMDLSVYTPLHGITLAGIHFCLGTLNFGQLRRKLAPSLSQGLTFVGRWPNGVLLTRMACGCCSGLNCSSHHHRAPLEIVIGPTDGGAHRPKIEWYLNGLIPVLLAGILCTRLLYAPSPPRPWPSFLFQPPLFLWRKHFADRHCRL